MKKLIYLICLIGLIGVVQGRYIDPTYVWVNSYTSGGNTDFIRISKDFAFTDIQDYFIFDTIAVGSANAYWQATVNNLFMVYQGGSTATNIKLTRYNKTDYDGYELLGANTTHNNRGRGVAIRGNFLYTIAYLGGSASKRYHNGSVIWNTDISPCLDADNYKNSLLLDSTNLYVICRDTFTGFNILNDTGGLIFNTSLTWIGLTGATVDARTFNLDSDFIYTFFINDTKSYLGKAVRNNPTDILAALELHNYTMNGGHVEIMNDFIYVLASNVTNKVLELFKINKNLELVSSVVMASGIEDVETTDNDLNYIYVGTDGTTATDGGLFVIDQDMSLIKHIQADIINALTVSNYRGGTGEGVGYFNFTALGRYDGLNLSIDDMLCALSRDVDGEWVEVGTQANDLNGNVIILNIQPDTYQMVCQLDSERYPNVAIGVTPYVQSYDFVIQNQNLNTIFDWYSFTNPRAYKNLTFYVFDLATNEPIESARIQVFKGASIITDGYTGSDGYRNYILPSCVLHFNITKDNYASRYIYSYLHDTEGQIIFVGLIKDYSISGSPCYVQGHITENGVLSNSTVAVSCSVNGIESFTSYSTMLNGFYNISDIPDGQTCTIGFKRLTASAYFLFQVWQPKSILPTQYNGKCLACACTFNETFIYNTRHYFRIHYGESLITDVNVNLYNDSRFNQYVTVDPDSSQFYSDDVSEGVAYILEIKSDYLEHFNYTFTANAGDNIHDIYLNYRGQDCIYRFDFSSDARYGYDQNLTELELFLDITNPNRRKVYNKRVNEIDEAYFTASTKVYEQFIDCRDTHTLAIRSQFFKLANYQPRSFSMDGHNSFEVNTIRIIALPNIDTEGILRNIKQWTWEIIPYVFWGIVILFFVFLIMAVLLVLGDR